MSAAAPSLIEQEAAERAAAPAFSFFDGIQIEQECGENAADGSREFTGERLHRERPDVYRAIVTAWANGLSQRQIARALRVSTNTVAAVVEREPDAVEAQKKRLVSGLRRFAGATVERMLEDLDRMPLQSLPVALGVAVDKLQLLTGEATQRVERLEVKEDAVRRYIESLPVIEGEVVEEQTTGIGGETDGQKGSVLGLPAPGVAVPLADLESGAFGADNREGLPVRASLRTSLRPDSSGGADLAGDHEGGGGGGAASGAPLPSMIDGAAQNFGQGVCASEPENGSGGMGPACVGPSAAPALCKTNKTQGRKRSAKKKGAAL